MPFIELTQQSTGNQSGSFVQDGQTINYTFSGSGPSYTAFGGYFDAGSSNLHLGANVVSQSPLNIFDANEVATLAFSAPVDNLQIRIFAQNSNEQIDFTLNGTDVNLNTLIANGDVTVSSIFSNPIDSGGNVMGGTAGGSLDGVTGMDTTVTFNVPVTQLILDHNNLLPGNAGSIIEVGLICFCRGALIKTTCGEMPVEALSVGDRVLTLDHGYQEIRWIGGRKVSASELETNPRLKPVRIRAGALGRGVPETDLSVSPQHRVLVSSPVALRMFGSSEVLIPANKLLVLPGIDIASEIEGVEYFHMLFDAHQVVWSNGALTESLFTGPEALKAVSPEARQEIATLFPDIVQPDFAPASARPIPRNGKQMKRLAERLAKNAKDAQDMTFPA